MKASLSSRRTVARLGSVMSGDLGRILHRARQHAGVDATPGITDTDQHILALQRVPLPVQLLIARVQVDLPGGLHRVTGIEDQVEQHHLQLAGVDLDIVQIIVQFHHQLFIPFLFNWNAPVLHQPTVKLRFSQMRQCQTHDQ